MFALSLFAAIAWLAFMLLDPGPPLENVIFVAGLTLLSIVNPEFGTAQAVLFLLALLNMFAAPVWWLVDLIRICAGKFADKRGRPLKKHYSDGS